MAKKTFKEKLLAQGRPSKNIEDRRVSKKDKAKKIKEDMDFYTPYNETLRSKDLKRAKTDDATALMNKINNSDGNRGKRLARYKSDTKPQKGFKK